MTYIICDILIISHASLYTARADTKYLNFRDRIKWFWMIRKFGSSRIRKYWRVLHRFNVEVNITNSRIHNSQIKESKVVLFALLALLHVNQVLSIKMVATLASCVLVAVFLIISKLNNCILEHMGYLKLVSPIFYQIFIFSKTIKNVFYFI